MKSKQFYFIQIDSEFFQSESMEILKEEAILNHDSISDYFVIYLKLILASLKTDGVIFDNDNTLSPSIIKRKIRFNLYDDYSKNLEIIDRCILSLAKENIITLTDKAIVINDLSSFVGSKKSKNQERILERNKSQEIISSTLEENKSNLKLQALNNLTSINNIDYILDGLTYFKFITNDEKKSFSKVVNETLEENNPDEFYKASSIFIKRLKMTDISKIENKEDYFKKSIENIIFKELRNETYHLDEILDELVGMHIITNANKLREYKTSLVDFISKNAISPEYLVSIFKKHRIKIFNNPFSKDSDKIISLLQILLKNENDNSKTNSLDEFNNKTLEEKYSPSEIEELQRIASYDYIHNDN